MNNNKNQIFSAEKVIEKEKELKEHPERNRVKAVSMTAEGLSTGGKTAANFSCPSVSM